MSYTVTYRNKEGRQEAIQLDAESRAALFAELSKRGISAVRVEESKGKAKKAKQSKAAAAPRKPSPVRGLFAGIVVIALAVAAWYYLLPTIEQVKVKREKKSSKIAEVKPSLSDVATPSAVVTNEPVKAKWTPETDAVHRDKNNQIIYDETAPLGSKANPIKFGIVDKPGNIKPPRKLYTTFSENYVASLLRHRPGVRIVGGILPANFDEEFKAHIADPIYNDPEDTEEDREIRAQMQELKKEMAGMIADGETPTDIILDARKELNKIADYRADASKELARLKREGASDDEIDDFIAAANVMMERYGAMKFLPRDYFDKIRLQKEQENY